MSASKRGSGNNSTRRDTPKPPLRWTGILFAFAANLLLVTLADTLAGQIGGSLYWELLATIVAPLVAGVAAALYAGVRGAMHAALGGLLSLPVLALAVFPGVWSLAVLSAAFCTLGGAFTELVTRHRQA